MEKHLYGKINKMINHLRSILTLVRFPNLAIIAATQYAMRYLIMEPLLPTSDFQLQFGNLQFFLLVLSTVPSTCVEKLWQGVREGCNERRDQAGVRLVDPSGCCMGSAP